MTKQIRLKDGKVLKVECCEKCPLIDIKESECGKSYDCLGDENLDVGRSLQEGRVHKSCPLEEYREWMTEQEIICIASKLQGSCPACPHYSACKDPNKPRRKPWVLYRNDPAAPKEQGTTTADNSVMVDPATDKRRDALEVNIKKMGVALAEKDAKIARLKNACEDKDHQLQDRWNRIQSDEGTIAEFAKENNRLFQKANDLEKALQYKCQMREAIETSKDEPELWICDHAEGCQIKVCNHIRPHKYWDGCDRIGCDSRPEIPARCIPHKEPTVPEIQQPDPTVRYYPISEGELREAIKDNLSLSEDETARNTKILAQILNRNVVTWGIHESTRQIKARRGRLDALERRLNDPLEDDYLSRAAQDIGKLLVKTHALESTASLQAHTIAEILKRVNRIENVPISPRFETIEADIGKIGSRLDKLEKNANLINVLDFQLKGVADCVDKLEKEIAVIKGKE